MLDIRYIRENPQKVQEGAKSKGYSVDISHLLSLDAQKRELQTKAEELRRERNELAATLKDTKPTDDQIAKGKNLKTELAEVEDHLRVMDEEFTTLLKKVPNMPLDGVPEGVSEDDNVVIKTVGEPPKFDFEPKNHWQIAEAHDWIDKERAAKVAGSRFAYIKGDLVMLQFALLQFTLSVLTDETKLQQIITDNKLQVSSKPFTPVLPPAVIRTDVYEATARLDGEEVTYKLADDELWLNASAEHSLSPMYQNEILDAAILPIRYIGYSTSFRREAGTYGKDMEGIFRMHQFDKIEMEIFSAPESSLQEHLFLVAIQEYLVKSLELPYRVLEKCTADIGGPNAKGVDIDIWLPGQNKYRETHSADLITDFQARRLQTRLRRPDGTIELVHTNDATAFATGRAMVAVIENNQTAEGRVKVPKVLQSYLGGKELL